MNSNMIVQVQENIFKNMYPGQNSQLNPEAGLTSWMPFIIHVLHAT